jgi:hypothetical protein
MHGELSIFRKRRVALALALVTVALLNRSEPEQPASYPSPAAQQCDDCHRKSLDSRERPW